jgi:NitT/TauT family transport system substrate-binding protein
VAHALDAAAPTAPPHRQMSNDAHQTGLDRRRKLVKRTLVIVAVLATALAAAAAVALAATTRTAGHGSTKLTTIRMVQEWPVADGFWIPWIVARDKGWYKQAGIDLKIIPPPTVADTVKFLGTGRADIGFTTILDVIFAKAQGAPITSIGAYSQSNNWGLIGRQGEKFTVASLKGKTIGIYNDAWTKAQLSIMLESAHLTLNDVKLVAAASDVVPLLLAKKVDVATGVTNAEASEVRTVGHQKPFMLLAKNYGVPNSPIWLIAGNTSWLQKNPALAKTWFRVTKRALDWSIANPKAAVQMFEKAYPKAESFAYALDQWKATIPLFKAPGGYFSQTNKQWSGLLPALVKQKLITKALAPSAYYTNAYNGSK